MLLLLCKDSFLTIKASRLFVDRLLFLTARGCRASKPPEQERRDKGYNNNDGLVQLANLCKIQWRFF